MINMMSRHYPSEHSLIVLAAMFVLLAIAAFTYLWLLATGNGDQGVWEVVRHLRVDPNDPKTIFGY